MGAEHSQSLSHGAHDCFACCDGKLHEKDHLRSKSVFYENIKSINEPTREPATPRKPQKFKNLSAVDHYNQEIDAGDQSPYSIKIDAGEQSPYTKKTSTGVIGHTSSLPTRQVFHRLRAGEHIDGPGVAVTDHPYLSRYFATLKKALHDVDGLSGEPLELKKSMWKSELQTIAKKTFAHHDGNNNKVLERNESKAFFLHYVQCYLQFYEHFTISALERSMSYGLEKNVNAEGRKLGQQVLHAQREEALRMYTKNQTVRYPAAFAVIDVNHDGRLQEQEVVAMMTPDDPVHEEVHRALGLRLRHPLERAVGAQHQYDDAEVFNQGHGPKYAHDEALGRHYSVPDIRAQQQHQFY